MASTFLKQASENGGSVQDMTTVTQRVSEMLRKIEAEGEDRTIAYARQLDGWEQDIVVAPEAIEAASTQVPESLKDDIRFAHENIAAFAKAQMESIREFDVELRPGLVAGQKLIPVSAAGCYVPGGRYSHIASAIMTVTTAKVAGVDFISACSPTRPETGIAPAILWTLDYCGADRVLSLGGVQAIAAMAFGQFGLPEADILVGPGNQYVAEAKRLLFGRTGIDMFAGPTDSLIIADETADPDIVAADLVGQAEHGYNSPVWLVTTSDRLARKVLELVPIIAGELPDPNRESALQAWDNLGEVVLCDRREDMVEFANRTGPEHLHVQASDLDWWIGELASYGSLFLGEETTVAFGDKASGPNHVLPTANAARYTGGLSVHKFLKTVTWQKMTRSAVRDVALATARISRFEGMEGHARSADIRLQKYDLTNDPQARIK
ncbi:histidinol dehydrogenase [uncultured Roseibium sp.]|uniref:histidinol dehydrogenase n=1 Tax=uncultured Roseibium sp. TaxID=1936171 RepID=UPI002617DB04|nr:histidinol dehydrogenase [uncultured Roseibium sp.]